MPRAAYSEGMAAADVSVLKQKLITKSLAAATEAAVALRQQLRDETPKHTGRTSRAWTATPPVFDGKAITFRIQHPFDGSSPDRSPRVEWLSEGTGQYGPRGARYLIVPRRKKVLAFPSGHLSGAAVFPTRTGGPIVFTKRVMHPGIKGTGFIDRVLSEANVGQVFQRAFQSVS